MAKRYTITGKAGAYVAGRKNPGAGSTLTLTDKQAEQPLRDGAIVPEGQPTIPEAEPEPQTDKQAKQPARKPAADKPAADD